LVKDVLKRELSDIDMEKIRVIKIGMNSSRKRLVNETTESIKINPNWFIGFLEGEGTFGVKIFLIFSSSSKEYEPT
jgi:hypothetical protein